MTAAEAFLEIETRRIHLCPTFDAALWHASVDVQGESPEANKRVLRTISVVDLTLLGAVESLCRKLDREAEDRGKLD
jgi:hypothetical protein